MTINGTVFCLFEQSGTFKNEFRRLGYEALDYDIQNNYFQTDYVVDLFGEIEKAYADKLSVFDDMTPDGLIMAFFPCIYFYETNTKLFTGTATQFKHYTNIQKLDYALKRSRQRQRMYELLLMLCTIAERRGLRLIIENPYTEPHYLTNNFPYKPAVIDRNRQLRGDYYRKPTQFFYIGCEPTYGESYQTPKERKIIRKAGRGIEQGICSEERSMIAPEYARNFICDFIIGKAQTRADIQTTMRFQKHNKHIKNTMEYEKIRETLDPLLRKTGVGEVEVTIQMGAIANNARTIIICHSTALAVLSNVVNGKTQNLLLVQNEQFDIHDVVSIERVPIETTSVINL